MIGKTKNKSKKTLILTAALIVIVVCGALVFFIRHKSAQAPGLSKPNGQAVKQEAQADAAKKKQLTEQTPSKTGDNQTSNSPPSPAKIELSAHQESDSTVTILTKLFNYSGGECEVTITNGGKSTSQKASVIYSSQYSLCSGFSIPISSVGPGTWTIKLDVTSNGATTTQTISYGVTQ